LTFSFGDTGTLIHPRYESGAPRRRAGLADISALEEDSVKRDFDDVTEDKIVVETPPKEASSKADLSKRLDSLLDKPEG